MLKRMLYLSIFPFIMAYTLNAEPHPLQDQGCVTPGTYIKSFEVGDIYAIPSYYGSLNLTGNRGAVWIDGGCDTCGTEKDPATGYWDYLPWSSIQVQVIIEDENGNVEFSGSYSVPAAETTYSFSFDYFPLSAGTHYFKLIVPQSCTGTVSFSVDTSV